MQFNSYLFGAFFAVVLAVYHLPILGWRGQKLWLLVTSYLFYAAWDPVSSCSSGCRRSSTGARRG